MWNLFKKKEVRVSAKSNITPERIASFDALIIKLALGLELKDNLKLVESKNVGIPEYLVVSYKNKAIATLYGKTFVTNATKFTKKDQTNVNKILESIMKHYQ